MATLPPVDLDALLSEPQSWKVVDDRSFRDLPPGANVLDEKILLVRCGYSARNNPPEFPKARCIAFLSCDKNFVFHWMKGRIFPKCETVLLASHPCEQWVFEDWRSKRMFLDRQWSTYLDRPHPWTSVERFQEKGGELVVADIRERLQDISDCFLKPAFNEVFLGKR